MTNECVYPVLKIIQVASYIVAILVQGTLIVMIIRIRKKYVKELDREE